jgi:succinyldiaminopimelate transaminase
MHPTRLDQLLDYPFDRLRALLADVTPAAGKPPLNLSLGEPQHAPPALLAEALAHGFAEYAKYPPLGGTPAFRAAAAAWLARRYALPEGFIDADASILPVSGTREALFMAAQLVVPESIGGRKPVVVSPNPGYAVYEGGALMAGAELVTLDATAASGFLPDLDRLDTDLLARTALMYLCTPSNPQGSVADADYLARAVGLAQAHGFVLAVDECYAEIYTGAPPPGVLSVLRERKFSLDNILAFHSLSKRSNAPGLRSGFVVGDPKIVKRFARLRSYAAAGMPLPVLAASAALWNDEAHVRENRAAYAEKFAVAERILGNRFGYRTPAGGFFLWLDVGDGEAATRKLWGEQAIRVLPGAYLTRAKDGAANHGRAYIRVALVHEAAIVEDALTRLVETLADERGTRKRA